MNKKGQTRMPMSFGGLVQYYAEYKSKIKISPRMVVVSGIVLVAIVLILRAVF